MIRKLVDLTIDEISLVTKPANKRAFLLVKSDGGNAMKDILKKFMPELAEDKLTALASMLEDTKFADVKKSIETLAPYISDWPDDVVKAIGGIMSNVRVDLMTDVAITDDADLKSILNAVTAAVMAKFAEANTTLKTDVAAKIEDVKLEVGKLATLNEQLTKSVTEYQKVVGDSVTKDATATVEDKKDEAKKANDEVEIPDEKLCDFITEMIDKGVKAALKDKGIEVE